MELLLSFLTRVETDPRITTAHISLYVALWKKWKDSGQLGPLSFFRYELIDLCKISGGNTYFKTMKELHEYGYIIYEPSYNRYEGSQVSLENRAYGKDNIRAPGSGQRAVQ